MQDSEVQYGILVFCPEQQMGNFCWNQEEWLLRLIEDFLLDFLKIKDCDLAIKEEETSCSTLFVKSSMKSFNVAVLSIIFVLPVYIHCKDSIDSLPSYSSNFDF